MAPSHNTAILPCFLAIPHRLLLASLQEDVAPGNSCRVAQRRALQRADRRRQRALLRQDLVDALDLVVAFHRFLQKVFGAVADVRPIVAVLDEGEDEVESGGNDEIYGRTLVRGEERAHELGDLADLKHRLPVVDSNNFHFLHDARDGKLVVVGTADVAICVVLLAENGIESERLLFRIR